FIIICATTALLQLHSFPTRRSSDLAKLEQAAEKSLTNHCNHLLTYSPVFLSLIDNLDGINETTILPVLWRVFFALPIHYVRPERDHLAEHRRQGECSHHAIKRYHPSQNQCGIINHVGMTDVLPCHHASHSCLHLTANAFLT